ncbi:MAG: ATP-binding protein [Planctomycetota bacterium]|jgi:signal transduction histidine kinase|nr:ATP-binding protein [Planctomycetota bacterium]MDP7128937.1 ATP-binding protein [Planctomycetota bacterium]MDP7251191.1 ATP-binding protein [Planctomycetota bacterium]
MSERFFVSTRFRILFLAVVAIAIPGIILAAFGFKLTSEQREGTEALVGRFYQTTADTVMGRVLDKVDEQENQVLKWLEDRPLGKWSVQIEELARRTTLADQFFVLSPSFEVIYPPTRETVFPDPIKWRSGPGGQGAETLLKAGNQLEFVSGDLAAAAKKYRTCADGPYTALFRAEALISLGACLKKLGVFDEAVEAYNRVATEIEPQDVPVSHRLVAQYQIGGIQEELGSKETAAETYLALYRQLANEPSSPEGSDTPEFFLASARERLNELAQDESIGVALSDQLKELKQLETRREGWREFRLEMDRWLAQRIKFELADRTTSGGKFTHMFKMLDSKPFLVAFTQAGGDVGKGNIFGFKIDLDYVKSRVLLPEVIDIKVGKGTVITFVNRESEPVLPVQMSKGGDVKFALTQEFPRIFDFWRLGVLDQENEELLVVSRNQNLLMTGVLALSITVMIGGLYLTLHYINRELELSRLKSDFVSNVSHELKTPLTLIRMFGETLSLGRVKNEEKAMEYYQIITRESERLTKLIDNVLDFSRIESGSKEYDFQIQNVGEVVQTTFESYRENLESQGFTCDLDIEEEVDLTAKVDRDSVEQALINLFTNARKYSKDEKEIHVSVTTDGEEIRIAVRDKGLGISEQDQQQIFDKFFRVEDDYVRSVRGSGLGLAITTHTLESHAGRIELKSALGEGSTFTLVLPVFEKEPDSKFQMSSEVPDNDGASNNPDAVESKANGQDLSPEMSDAQRG